MVERPQTCLRLEAEVELGKLAQMQTLEPHDKFFCPM